jgi:hypothetical protein
MFGKVGIAVDIAGSAAHVARSMDHILDTELHSRMRDSNRGHMLVPVHRGCLRRSNR